MGDDLPTLTMAGQKGSVNMNMNEFRRRMLLCAFEAGQLLCEITLSEDIKKEPEQVRKNVATILTLLVETMEFLEGITADVQDSD